MSEPRYKTQLETSRVDSNSKKVLSDFIVIDKRGRVFKAPAGMITDGKSVPEFLEPLIGDPFEGVTEPASIIHDWYCDVASFATSKLTEPEKKKKFKNYNLLKIYFKNGGEVKSQKDTHRVFRELTMFEMKHNKEYGWFLRWPWNNKAWQYSRAWKMWSAVRVYNKIKNPKWE